MFQPSGVSIFWLSVIFFIIGILVGTHMSIWAQIAFIVGWCFFLNTPAVKELEMGVFAYVTIFICFIIGIIIGDISYFVQTDALASTTSAGQTLDGIVEKIGNIFSIN